MSEQNTSENEIDFAVFLDVLLRRRWLILVVAVVVFSAAALVTYTLRPVYQAQSMLLIEKERGAGAVYANGAVVESRNDDYYQTQYKILQSRSLNQHVYDQLKLGEVPEFAGPRGVDALVHSVSIVPVPRSRLVYVRADSFDPKLAARISNTVSEIFVAENLSNQLFISKDVLQTLQVSQNSPNARQLYESLPQVVSNNLVQGLKTEYAKLESQQAEMSQKLTEKHPTMVAIRSNMRALRMQINAETDKVVQSLKTELSGQLKGNNVRIVDPAQIPESPIRPKKLMNLLLGLVGGLLAGVVLAYLIELIDQTVRTQDDIEKRLNLPFLGIIPMSGGKKGAVPYASLMTEEASLTSESFRNLRTMVDLAGVGTKAKQILVTSSVQGEGKSFLAANLAVAFAQNGESVLLIDGDMRRPTVHKSFSRSTEHGLSEFLAKGDSVHKLDKLVQATDVPGLKVLPCGPRPPNPSELLNTPRVSALLAWADSTFDRVVVDCTPMFPINDTLLWGRHVKSVVFVSWYGKTRLPLAKKAQQRIHGAGLKILGVAINAAKPGGLTYAGYGYYYQQYYQEYLQAPEKASTRS
jgi:capsular exopolysaccharide synthesis family protein